VRFGRLVTRTLFVLGGAVAGTAAAWLISDAVASADTVTPITDATVAGLGDAVSDTSQATNDLSCHQDATAWSMPGSEICGAIARDQIGGPAKQSDEARVLGHEVSGRVGDSVTDLTQDAVLDPAKRTLGAFEHIARKPEDTQQVLASAFPAAPAANDFWQLLDPAGHGDLIPLPQLPVLPVEQEPVTAALGHTTETVEAETVELPASVRAALAQAAAQRAAQETRGHGSRHDVPAPLTPAQLPVAPSVPPAPGGGSAPGGHFDGLNFGLPFGFAGAIDNAVAGTNRAGRAHTPRTPGSQPGVTPD
jgi:hypothetical protein